MFVIRTAAPCLAAATLCAVLVPDTANAGAWSYDPGTWQTFETLEMFAADGPNYEFSQLTIRTRNEYGLAPRLHVGSVVGHAQQQVSGPNYDIYLDGINQAEVYAQYALPTDGRRVSALRMTGIFKTSTYVQRQRAMGQDAALGLSWLTGVGDEHFFAEADMGYRRSLGDDADQLRLEGTLGLKRGRAMLLVQSFHTKSVLPKDVDGVDYDLGQLSVSAVLPVRKRVRFEIGARADLYTRAIDPGMTAFFSIWWSS